MTEKCLQPLRSRLQGTKRDAKAQSHSASYFVSIGKISNLLVLWLLSGRRDLLVHSLMHRLPLLFLQDIKFPKQEHRFCPLVAGRLFANSHERRGNGKRRIPCLLNPVTHHSDQILVFVPFVPAPGSRQKIHFLFERQSLLVLELLALFHHPIHFGPQRVVRSEPAARRRGFFSPDRECCVMKQCGCDEYQHSWTTKHHFLLGSCGPVQPAPRTVQRRRSAKRGGYPTAQLFGAPLECGVGPYHCMPLIRSAISACTRTRA